MTAPRPRLPRPWLAVAMAAVALLAAACLPPAPTRGPSDPQPVYNTDFPDPSLIRVGATYFAFSTNSGLGTIPVASSVDLQHWSYVGDAVPRLPSWAYPGANWAPAVFAHQGRFLLYFATVDAGSGLHCIAVMAADDVVGPYEEVRSGPLHCTAGTSTIDPSPFRLTDGSVWLTWKVEPVGGEPTTLWSARLSSDGLSLVSGTSARLLVPETSFDAHNASVPGSGNIENPMMLVRPEGLFLLYSAHLWDSSRYNIGAAVCAGPSGPCARVYSTPLLESRGSMAGPGGPTVVADPGGGLWLGFHAWRGGPGYPEGYRPLFVLPLGFENGMPIAG